MITQAEKLEEEIFKIGERLTQCSLNCEGICCNAKMGILPRYLVLEKSKTPSTKECVIVGINPGNANKTEKTYFKNTENKNYKKCVEFWENNTTNYDYYEKLRNLAKKLGFTGQILWTELVKCENKEKGKIPSISTFRTCAKEFLDVELKLMKDYTLIAISKNTYNLLSYKYTDRNIIGVPHPKAWGGQFNRLLTTGYMEKKYKDTFKALKGKTNLTMWIGE